MSVFLRSSPRKFDGAQLSSGSRTYLANKQQNTDKPKSSFLTESFAPESLVAFLLVFSRIVGFAAHIPLINIKETISRSAGVVSCSYLATEF